MSLRFQAAALPTDLGSEDLTGFCGCLLKPNSARSAMQYVEK